MFVFVYEAPHKILLINHFQENTSLVCIIIHAQIFLLFLLYSTWLVIYWPTYEFHIFSLHVIAK